MNDSEFEQLLERKYAQVVFKALLDAEGHSYAFNDLQKEVNAIVDDDSRGTRETIFNGKYTSTSLGSLLSSAKDAGIVEKYLNNNGQIRWRLRRSQLSQSNVDEIRFRTSQDIVHTDLASVDYYQQRHADPALL
jgi:hypothetical protein